MGKWNELNNLIQTCYSITQKTSIIYVQYEEKQDNQLILSIVIEAQLYQLIFSGQKSLQSLFNQLHWISDDSTFIYWFQENFIQGRLYTTLVHPHTCSISIGEAPNILTLSCPMVEEEEKSKQFIQALLIKLSHHIQQQNKCKIITRASFMHKKQQQVYPHEIHAASTSSGNSNPEKLLSPSSPSLSSSSSYAPQPKKPTTATRIQRLQPHDRKKTEHAFRGQTKRKGTSLINPGSRKPRSKSIQFEDPENM